MEGNLHFKIDWGSRIVGREFTVFTLFYFVFEGNFQVQAPGGLILFWRGDLTEGFLRYEFGGLIFGGAYFQNFTVFATRVSALLCDQCVSHMLCVQEIYKPCFAWNYVLI